MPEELSRDGAAEVNRALVLDGRDDCVLIDDAADLNPAGPFTLEPGRVCVCLGGYRSERSLDESELAALPKFLLAR